MVHADSGYKSICKLTAFQVDHGAVDGYNFISFGFPVCDCQGRDVICIRHVARRGEGMYSQVFSSSPRVMSLCIVPSHVILAVFLSMLPLDWRLRVDLDSGAPRHNKCT